MFADQETVERLRKEFPKGCRIVCDKLDDPYTKIPAGTQGVCRGVDDVGSVMAIWDCGSSLSLAYPVDKAHRVASEEEIKGSLNWLGKLQETAEKGHCPRCGAELESFRRHALSRYANVTVCDLCGVQESLEVAGLCEKKPLTEWYCTKEWKL